MHPPVFQDNLAANYSNSVDFRRHMARQTQREIDRIPFPGRTIRKYPDCAGASYHAWKPGIWRSTRPVLDGHYTRNPVATDLRITVNVEYAHPNGQYQDKALAGQVNVRDIAPRLGLFVPASGTHGTPGISFQRQAFETYHSSL